MIEIKAFFKWRKVESREEALKFAKYMYNKIRTTSDPVKMTALVNKIHVRGTVFTIDELRA